MNKLLIFSSTLFIISFFFACSQSDSIATINPFSEAIMWNKSYTYSAKIISGKPESLVWDFGDKTKRVSGKSVNHKYATPGIYTITLFTKNGEIEKKQSTAIVRVHNSKSVGSPQLFLDTDARNEADDQHYIAYCVYSNMDVLGINSIHNNEPYSETINYAEIFYVFKMMNWSGTSWDSLPLNKVYHGACEKLEVPASGKWYDTEPIVTEASKAILAAARGASPDNPVWIMPVGPCTNIASAVLQARKDGFDIQNRIRVYWLGGLETEFLNEYNGGNDPWSVYVMGKCGIDFTVMLADPTSLKLNIDKRVEADLYPDNELGDYLEKIIPVFQWHTTIPKSIHDVCVPAAILGDYLNLGWVKRKEQAGVSGPENDYKWVKADSTSNITLVWDIDGVAMKKELFNTLSGNPVSLY